MTHTTRYPATFAQRSMFLQNALHPSDNAFDLAFAYRIEGKVDVGRLQRVLASIITATPGISTHFHNEPDGLVAIVQRGSATLETLPIPQLPGAAGLDHEDAWVVAETESALDAGPISPTASAQMRMRLYLGEEATYFTLMCGHIVGDAYSFYKVIGAIGALYGSKEAQWPAILAGLSDHPGTVPPPAVTDAAKTSYRELLTGIGPFEHAGLVPPRIDGSIRGIERSILLAGDAAEIIRSSDAVREFGAATVFFAAYASTLQRLSGEATVTLGVPVAGRSGHRTKNAIGFFVNTLPLPVHFDGDQTWWELCQQVKSGLRVLQANQGVDLAGADSALVSGGANFRGVDNAITLYKQGLVLLLDGCEISSLPLRRTSLPYPLSVTVADNQQGYDVVVKCADHLVEALPEKLLMEAIGAITTEPSTPVVNGEVFVTDPGRPPMDPMAGSGTTVLDAIEQAARDNPLAIALRSRTQTMSYGELVAKAHEFARSLEASSASKYVVVRLPKSFEAVIAMLGVMSACRVYVPVDPDSPSVRTDLILSRLEQHLGGPPTVIDAGSMNELVSAGTTLRRAVRRPGGDDEAYVIFTSGSTGEPKGVVIPHSNLVALLDSTLVDFGFGPDDTWCAFHSFAFDFSIWEIFGALASGGSVVIPTADEVTNPDAFVKLLQRERVSVLNQTPSAFRRLSAVATVEPGALDSVRIVVFGGEALYPSDLRTWVARVGTKARFINMYGITETTVHVTAYELSAEDIDFEHRSPIGRPLRHLGGLVIDQFGRECPVGVPGELLVTGSSLARGYLGRPDLTETRFRTIESNGERLTAYLTGDKVSQQASGELVYIGRLDDQVQLRGYRIEFGEIESAFSSCEDAAASVVRLVERDGIEPYLVAWIAVADWEGTYGDAAGDEGFNWSDEALQQELGAIRRSRAFIRRIRKSLATRLPHYMMPSVIVPVRRIPTTINGKPDVPQLLVLEEAHRRATTGQKVADGSTLSSVRHDRSPIEAMAGDIASIWSSTIGTGAVGIEDRFMDVGGTSMHVMEVHSRLRTQLGLIDVELIDLFEHATPLALASHLSKKPQLVETSAYQGELV